jgi:hypothetical protein
MRYQRMLLVFCSISLTLFSPFTTITFAQETLKSVPKEVAAITGTFTGSWTMFGIDQSGQVVKRMAWTDVIKAENPVVKGDRAFVTTTDEMTFEGGKIPPTKVKGTEGYFLNKDGSLGDYYYETYGKEYRLQRLGKETWAYVIPADPRELGQLGFSKVSFAQHALIKVVTNEQGAETHRITRVTTVNWKDADGKERWLQFVSLQGVHKKQS